MCQKHILRRKAKPGDFWNVMILDEYGESITEFDAKYLAQCRSHLGCALTLTQTINSEYAAMGGNRYKANQLLGNFGTHIFHVSDAETAKFASALLGQQRESFVSYQPKEGTSLGEEMFGMGCGTGNLSESYQPILQTSAFLNGLRSGGPQNNYCVDGIVIRLGEPFRTGNNYQFQ
jgi:hypothetical protein